MSVKSRSKVSKPSRHQPKEKQPVKRNKKAEVEASQPSSRKRKASTTRQELSDALWDALKDTPAGVALLQAVGFKATKPEKKPKVVEVKKPKPQPEPPKKTQVTSPPVVVVKPNPKLPSISSAGKKKHSAPPVTPPKESLKKWEAASPKSEPKDKPKKVVVEKEKKESVPQAKTPLAICREHPLLQAVKYMEKFLNPKELAYQSKHANKSGLPLDVSMALSLLSFFNIGDQDLRNKIKNLADK